MTKEKSKVQVFAAVLDPDEDIVWSFAPTSSLVRTVVQSLPIRRSFVLAISTATLVIMLLYVFAGVPDAAPRVGLAALVLSAIAFGPRIVWAGLLAAFNAIGAPPQKEAFAVTTQRILLRRGEQIHTLALERVPPVTVFPNGSRGTISFGATFPMWINVENVHDVKLIIERAQKERLKAIQA